MEWEERLTMHADDKKINFLNAESVMMVATELLTKLMPDKSSPYAMRIDGQGNGQSHLPVSSSTRFSKGSGDLVNGAKPTST